MNQNKDFCKCCNESKYIYELLQDKSMKKGDYDGKRICDGAWRYGAYGINQVKNELKYWRLCKRQEKVISELKLAISCLETFKKKNNWKLLGFEIPLQNSLKWLEGAE